jgi:hypothetical protein
MEEIAAALVLFFLHYCFALLLIANTASPLRHPDKFKQKFEYVCVCVCVCVCL